MRHGIAFFRLPHFHRDQRSRPAPVSPRPDRCILHIAEFVVVADQWLQHTLHGNGYSILSPRYPDGIGTTFHLSPPELALLPGCWWWKLCPRLRLKLLQSDFIRILF